MNPDLQKLHPYPFEKLTKLLSGVSTPDSLTPIALSIGEPKHEPPRHVIEAMSDNLHRLANYPNTKGLPELRESIVNWLNQRFNIKAGLLSPDQHVLPVNGTREAIFSFTQALVDSQNSNGVARVISPNPFYQIYEGAALLAGAELTLLPTTESTGFVPDYDAVSDEVWEETQLLFVCSPGNPTGAVTNSETLKKLIALADKHDFVIASDECYSEVYCDENKPPVGLLQVCAEIGRNDFSRCVVFHSLSKRSNLPGLRSGFIAGDHRLLKEFFKYRTYHGCAMPIQTQLASIAAWNDEAHVVENRSCYKEKFDAVLEILQPVLDVQQTDASFYLWPKTPINDEEFAKRLFSEQHVTVLPGSYLSRTVNDENPGKNRVRMALVAPLDECIEAARRIKAFVESLKNKTQLRL